ncbi:PIN domain-containing protein [Salinisphaera sp. P385]|uniref:PIN domain-containing protein n=1 Tax=Spectribacter acetivorans TaxID=3075603 RepID=A0ABU3BBQ6_9GAMM|nr:PIN domain-containing protein [Salinisphaera sp. P385]MDT0619911.1 PIN domain-containing protein [Salinisphaera sp. P385]
MDASVLYSAPLTDLFVRLCIAGLYRASWSDSIHEEWMRALLADRPDLTREDLVRRRDAMDEALPDAAIDGYEGLIPGLDLPDPGDRHVLAAAVRARTALIVTHNLKDFPAERLEPYALEGVHPDTFACDLYYLNPKRVAAIVEAQRSDLRKPPMARADFLSRLEACGLVEFVRLIEAD